MCQCVPLLAQGISSVETRSTLPPIVIAQLDVAGREITVTPADVLSTDGSAAILPILQVVEARPNVRGIRIRAGNAILGERMASTNKPLTPNSGRLQPRQVVRWTASDADTDALIYNVFYSADAGRTWRVRRRDCRNNRWRSPTPDDFREENWRSSVMTEPGGAESAGVHYRLMSSLPRNGLPFMPSDPGGAPPVKLAFGAVMVDGVVQTAVPQRRVSPVDLSLAAEEVPRDGLDVARFYRRARWVDGSTRVWAARRRRPASGEASRALQFDDLEAERKNQRPCRVPRCGLGGDGMDTSRRRTPDSRRRRDRS